MVDGGALAHDALSRRQMRIELNPDGLIVHAGGKRPVLFNGTAGTEAFVPFGSIIEIRHLYVFLVTKRPLAIPPSRYVPRALHAFGEPDADGIVGESARAWALREELAAVAAASPHVLLLGPSGAGKDLAARAIHRASERSRGPFVERNVATLPESLMEAELFGHARDYPERGMSERLGLVGQAEGGTLFLDEIADLSDALQARLLTVMEGGVYHRLGDNRARKANVRIVAATNRPIVGIRPELFARFSIHVTVPSLDERREDVPLLFRHVALRSARESPKIAARFVREIAGRMEIDVDSTLVAGLARRSYPLNVRELQMLLWKIMPACRGDRLVVAGGVDLPPPEPLRVPPAPQADPPEAAPSAPNVDLLLDPRGTIVAALARNGGSVRATANELRVSRATLYRQMQTLGIARPADPE
jgi:DNA-binding NtrC family response regulator